MASKPLSLPLAVLAGNKDLPITGPLRVCVSSVQGKAQRKILLLCVFEERTNEG